MVYFRDKRYFKDDGKQNWLVFQPIQNCFQTVITTDGNLKDESIKPPTTSNKLLNPSLDFVGTNARVIFNGDCLKQEKIPFNQGKHLHCL